ncbi:LysR substrate-binding domain-containing protein [Pigmentiphaga soli]|uniref:LysR substrate-binding domain-containing protein n=2 Tax=Pigmentiphaga soli TaxID=1007095 RepID=A0ABP8HJP9_9BURK
MEVFISVYESGSFSTAARALNKTPSSISKLIQRLEDRLGAQLFYRNSRSVRPTEDGRTFFLHGQRAVEAMADAETAVAGKSGRLVGRVRIATMLTFAKYQIAPLIPEFSRRFPDLEIEFHLAPVHADLLENGIDLSIRSGPLEDSSLVSKHLASSRWTLCASPEYLARHGVPKRPEDLKGHNCLKFAMPTHWNNWHFNVPAGLDAPPGGSMSADQGDMLLELARHGVGIVRLAQFHIHGDLQRGTLVPLLEDFESMTPEPLTMVYPARRNLSQKVAAVVAFLEEKFGHVPPWERNTR